MREMIFIRIERPVSSQSGILPNKIVSGKAFDTNSALPASIVSGGVWSGLATVARLPAKAPKPKNLGLG